MFPGTFSLTEVPVPGWALTDLVVFGRRLGRCCDQRRRRSRSSAGDDVTCTYTNTKLGSITIVKDAVPNGPTDFGFTTTGTGLSPFSLDDDADGTLPNTTTFSGLLPGSFSVTEDVVAELGPHRLVVFGTGGTGDTGTRTATITLAAGDNVTCTYTNTERLGPGRSRS